MGIRMDQFIGLSGAAQLFLDEHAEQDHFELHKNGEVIRQYSQPRRSEGKYCWHGMFDDGNKLPGYLLKDGRIVYEMVQAEPWSSGPCIFTCLVDESEAVVEGTAWSDEDIEAHL